MLRDDMKQYIKHLPDAEKANCILTYGYIDNEAGLTMEVICAGIRDGNMFTFFECSEEVRAILRIGSVIEDEFYVLDDSDETLSSQSEYYPEMVFEYTKAYHIVQTYIISKTETGSYFF